MLFGLPTRPRVRSRYSCECISSRLELLKQFRAAPEDWPGVVLDLWYYEDSLLSAERKERAASLVAHLERLAEFFEATPTTPSLLVSAARQSGLTACDGAYWPTGAGTLSPPFSNSSLQFSEQK